jgi:hypothetical protein
MVCVMNRRQRRAQGQRLSRHQPTALRQIRDLKQTAETIGAAFSLVDLPGACVDCGATGDLTVLPDGRMLGDIYHDEGCPAAQGITRWAPCQ